MGNRHGQEKGLLGHAVGKAAPGRMPLDGDPSPGIALSASSWALRATSSSAAEGSPDIFPRRVCLPTGDATETGVATLAYRQPCGLPLRSIAGGYLAADRQARRKHIGRTPLPGTVPVPVPATGRHPFRLAAAHGTWYQVRITTSGTTVSTITCTVQVPWYAICLQ